MLMFFVGFFVRLDYSMPISGLWSLAGSLLDELFIPLAALDSDSLLLRCVFVLLFFDFCIMTLRFESLSSRFVVVSSAGLLPESASLGAYS